MMKKQILSLAIFTIALTLAACSNSAATEETRPTPIPIDESNTFRQHLDSIWQLIDAPQAQPPPTQHEIRHQRLREFAKNLNDGGIALSDVRIAHIISHPERHMVWHSAWESTPVHFNVLLMHEADYNCEEFIEEVLAFTGIPRGDISFTLSQTGWIGAFWGQRESYDFMLGNQAIYDFMRPYLRLREFAEYVNKGTYRDEIVVTSIWDSHQQQPIGIDLPYYFFPRFTIGLSPHGYENTAIRNEMLEFAGLSSNDVQFERTHPNPRFLSDDFLHTNEGYNRLHQQTEMLQEFRDLIRVRSTRRGIVIDHVLGSWFPAGIMHDGPGINVEFGQHHINNEDLKELFFTFTGLDREETLITKGEERVIGWTVVSRSRLTPEQSADLLALEEFVLMVNAPFWEDRYQHDPVIIGIHSEGRISRRTNELNFTNHIIWLYDPDLMGLTRREIRQQTIGLRNEIIAATGVRDIQFRVSSAN